MLRNKDLCPGPSDCPEVLMEDPLAAGQDTPPCAECPKVHLLDYLNSTGGQLISLVIDLDFAIQLGMDVPLSQITYPEFLMLRQLSEERHKFEAEEQKRARDRH
jgi:hypothetical protein